MVEGTSWHRTDLADAGGIKTALKYCPRNHATVLQNWNHFENAKASSSTLHSRLCSDPSLRYFARIVFDCL